VSLEVIYLLIYLFFVVLNLNRSINVLQNISHGYPNIYSLTYEPSPDDPPANPCLIIKIDKTKNGKITLKENRCSKKTNHIMCKNST
jgi:hypothetical protein